MAITTYEMTDVTYVHTHLYASVDELAETAATLLGRWVTVSIWDRGALKRRRVQLAAVGGENVAFWYCKRRFVMPLVDVFGQECTHVHK